jgi:hypothetical protein
MNFQAAVKGIAPAGGIRPASHITASFVSATKAKPAAHYFAAVIEGRLDISGRSDLSRSSTLSGSMVTRMSGSEAGLRPATSISGGIHGLSARMELKSTPHWSRKIGNPRAEKVSAHRSRQLLFV